MPPFLLSIAERVFSTAITFAEWAPRLAVARLIAKWRSLVTIIVGVILGSGIGALVPLYTTAVSQVGLVQRMEDEPAHDANARLRISFRPANFTSFEALETAVAVVDEQYIREPIRRHLGVGEIEGWITDDDIINYVETDKMGVLVAEEAPLRPLNTTDDNARASLLALDGWEDEVRIIRGTLPSEATLPEGTDFNVAISSEVSNTFGLEPGDTLIVDQRLSRDGRLNPGAWETSRPFVVHISAIIAPLDESSAYWMAMRGQDDHPLMVISENWPAEFRFLVSNETALAVAENYVPQTPTTFGWRLVFEHDELPYSHINVAREALRDLDLEMYSDFVGDNSEIVSQLDLVEQRANFDLQYDYHTRLIDYSQTQQDVDRGILQDYAKEQEVNAVPFTLLLLEVGALVLFFLMMTAALVRRSERREIAMLQSRGAFDGHILALRGIEALLICVFGAIVAPFLAQQLLIWLGPSVAGTDEFPLPLTATVFLYSLVAAAVTFVALTLTLIPVLRLPLISAGGAASRSDKLSWWQRYYVDVLLAVIGLVALLLLISRDKPLLEGEENRIDPLLVLAPALLFLGLGSIALRLYPVLANGVSVIVSRRPGLLGPLATWQLSREPVHYGRITFLLALAVGIGWFATSFRATVRRSQADQANYMVGTDVRLYERDTALNVDRVREDEYYEQFSEVESASVAYRTRVNVISRTAARGSRSAEILGYDASSFGAVALDHWRSDLGNIIVPRSEGEQITLPEVGEALPVQRPAKIGIWARVDLPGSIFTANVDTYQPNLNRLLQRVRLGIRLQDGAGAWIVLPFEPVRVEYIRESGPDAPGFGAAAHVSSGWVYYEADLASQSYQPQGELRLVSIYWEHRSNSPSGENNIRMVLGEMTLIDEAGEATLYEILQSGSWDFAFDVDRIQPAGIAEILHDDVLYITFNQDTLRARVGINLSYPDPEPIEAVISDSMAEIGRIDINPENPQSFTLYNVAGANVIIKPEGSTEYFPTLYNEEHPFVVVDVYELMYWLNQRPWAQYYPNEAWLELADGYNSIDEVNAVLDDLVGGDESNVNRVQAISYAQQFDDLETDPLALGLLGLMFLAFLIALVLSIVGLVTYSGLTAQARRGEFGVLRALGLSSMRVVWSLILEQLFVVLIGGILGSVLGFILSIFVVPTLALGTTGEGVVPPFITETEWAAIGNFWLIMLVVLLVVFTFSFGLVRQLSVSRSLRLGEE